MKKLLFSSVRNMAIKSILAFCMFSFFSLNSTGQTVLWTEGFNSGFPNNGYGPTWTSPTTGVWTSMGTSSGWHGSNFNSAWRSASIYMLAGNSNNDSMFLITPAQSLTAKSAYKLSYWMRNYQGTDNFTIKILVGTAATMTALNAGSTLATFASPAQVTTTYQEYSGTFIPATSGTYYFCIYAKRLGQFYVFADDVSLTRLCDAPTAGTVTGPSSICSGATNQTYSISGVSGTSLTYSWTVPSGASLASTNNTSSTTMTVNWGSTAGSVNCFPISTGLCIGNAVSYPVSFIPAPAQPSAITLPPTICVGATATYSVTAAADHYGWSNTAGWTGSSTTNSINLTANSSSTTITVTPYNICNEPGIARTAIAAPNLPVPNTPGPIVQY